LAWPVVGDQAVVVSRGVESVLDNTLVQRASGDPMPERPRCAIQRHVAVTWRGGLEVGEYCVHVGLAAALPIAPCRDWRGWTRRRWVSRELW
jgi:hypothetical protein